MSALSRIFRSVFALMLGIRCLPALAEEANGGRSLDEVLELHATAVLPAAALEGPRAELGERVWTQPAVGLRVTVHPIEHSYIRLTGLFYPMGDLRESWAPDLVYSLGYGDWRPWNFFFDHSNFTGNKWPWREEADPAIHWAQGLNTMGYRYELPTSWKPPASSRLWFGGAVMGHYGLRYGRLDGTEGKHLFFFSNSFQSTWREHLFGELRLFWYPLGATQQQIWDPDFTWSLGWMDWRPWSVSVRWSNYAGNRYPGSQREGNGGLGTGALFLDFRFGLEAGPGKK